MMDLRKAEHEDLAFLVDIDLKNDGYSDVATPPMTRDEQEQHRSKIQSFLTDPDRGAYLFTERATGKRIGMIMYSIANVDMAYPWKTIYNELDREWFQADGRVLEIFGLWVHPAFRRRGLATALKRTLEDEAAIRGVDTIYTHTEERNHHVIALNEKLGYREVRRGPIWDEIVRVSLIKRLGGFRPSH